MPYNDANRDAGRKTFERNRTPEQRAEFFAELSRAGVQARKARKEARDEALDNLVAALETLTGAKFRVTL